MSKEQPNISCFGDLSRNEIVEFKKLDGNMLNSTIQGVVISKSARPIESNMSFDFSFTLQDKSGDHLECTYNGQVTDDVYNFINEGETYYIYNGSISNIINKQKSIKKSSSKKVDLSKNTIIKLDCLDTKKQEITIQGVIIFKSEKIDYNNGYYFKFILQEKGGDELECKCYNKLCDEWFDKIFENETYYICDGSFKEPIDKCRRERLVDVDCVIESYTVIQRSQEKVAVVSKVIPIEDLVERKVGSLYTICCCVVSIEPDSTTSPKGIPFRKIKVIDQTNHIINITFFGDNIVIPDNLKKNQIVEFKNVRKDEFDTSISLAYLSSSTHNPTPFSFEANALQKYCENIGYNFNQVPLKEIRNIIPSYIPLITLSEFQSKPDHFSGNSYVICYITSFITTEISYKGCDGCHKKIETEEVKVCGNCKKNFVNPQKYYKVIFYMADSDTQLTGVMFNREAQNFFNKSVGEMLEWRENDQFEYEEFFKHFTHKKYVMRLTKQDNNRNDIAIVTYICELQKFNDWKRITKDMTAKIDEKLKEKK
ncbi:Replication factor A protein 1 [Entamoeba marina]